MLPGKRLIGLESLNGYFPKYQMHLGVRPPVPVSLQRRWGWILEVVLAAGIALMDLQQLPHLEARHTTIPPAVWPS